ncbi:MAG TPA: CDP-alcohol phosphatidyltransferase family protein [Ktedonobacteraceae bacterium]
MTVDQGNPFVVDLLTTLRAEKFRLTAWWRFLRRSWGTSCVTARDNPLLYRSWAYTTVGIAVLACCLFCGTIAGEGFSTAIRLLPGLVFCVAWQQCDLFWHLGLNRLMYDRPSQKRIRKFRIGKRGPSETPTRKVSTRPLSPGVETSLAGVSLGGPASKLAPFERPLHLEYTGKLRQRIGLANTVTLLRGLCSAYLLARILGGLSTPNNIVLIVFLSGCTTDMLDGVIARSTGTCSKLGQILDSEIDFTFYLVVSIVLLQNGILPLWLCVMLWLRFCLPLCAALVSYFVLARLPHISSTIWGKCAGLCQALYILVLLAPPDFSFVIQSLHMSLLIALIVLFGAALLAQVFKARRDLYI